MEDIRSWWYSRDEIDDNAAIWYCVEVPHNDQKAGRWIHKDPNIMPFIDACRSSTDRAFLEMVQTMYSSRRGRCVKVKFLPVIKV